MERQVTITLPCSVGDLLYTLDKFQIKEYRVTGIKAVTKSVDAGDFTSCSIKIKSTAYRQSMEMEIPTEKLGTEYFFDKKEITKLIVDQL